ncbi:MAG: RnfH family protein [Xanthomonadaceae bacterium]|jgi:putative ubiquitin-RnfH superfamily antitoxin RatB of RatAB toxin-antitoxin module|nr:RnfH family protein [Xanthomonadaceae bacterium]
MLRIEVILAWPHRFLLRTVVVPEGALVGDAVKQAHLEDYPGVAGYAIFGVVVPPDTPLCDGDRVELLRPLTTDPKEARRRRAESSRG